MISKCARQHGTGRHFSFRTKGAPGQYVATPETGSNGEKLYSNDCHGACRMGFSHYNIYIYTYVSIYLHIN